MRARDGVRWYIRSWGDADAPLALLLHGAGASGHSFETLAPLLAHRFRVVAPDLPGHGGTRGGDLSLPGMVAGLEGLLDVLGGKLALLVAHSAGAALALHLARTRVQVPVVGINPSFERPGAAPAFVTRAVGAVLTQPVVTGALAALARHTPLIDGLLDSTGSQVPQASRATYRALHGDPDRLGAVLRMFQSWSGEDLLPVLRSTAGPVLLLTGGADRWIAPDRVRALGALIPGGRVETLAQLGHLAHEEQPERIAARVLEFVESAQRGGHDDPPSAAGAA